ncbi:MAG: ATP-binding protein [Xanthobacteraceae bacterium]
MNDRVAPDLVSQFAVEIGEHLAAIEPILVAADFEAPRRSDIDLLFRGFHSIKGLARVLGAKSMEAVAHEAESLLSLVRSGDRGFDATVQEPLIAATDALKDALGAPLVSPVPPAIIDGLRRAATATERVGSVEASTGSETWRFLGDDLDLLRAFAELLHEIIPEAAQAIADGAEHALGEAIGVLVHACTRLGLDGMRAIADRVASRSGTERLHAFAELMRHAARFAKLVGVAACPAAAALEFVHGPLRATLEHELEAALMAEPAERPALALRCAGLCAIVAPASGAGRLLADIVERPPSTVAFAGDIDPLLRDAIAAVRQGLDAGGEPDRAVAALRDALGAPYRAGDEIEAHLRRLGLDVGRFSPGPPRRVERLSTLLDGSGTTLKEVIIESPTTAAHARLAPLDPLLGQSGSRGDGAVAVLLLDAEETGTVADRVRRALGDLAADVRRLDPGRVGEFSQSPGPAADQEESAEEAQVRVPVEVLDKLFGRIGEFFSLGSRLNVLATESDVPNALRRLADFAVTRTPELRSDIDILVRQHRDFCTVEVDVARIISLIHESTLGLRVIPLDTVVSRFPRLVRETARRYGKQVRFLAETGGIRIDKGMADMLADPLTHMLRNAIDHGIEPEPERLAQGKPRTATLRLNAQQQANRIVLEVGDDGRGIDLERVKRHAISSRLASADEIERMSDEQVARFIFTPGFSTAAQVSEVSGRGVGMDVVLVNVTKLGGKIDIATRAGQGTTFTLDLPLSAAIQPMLLADTGLQPIGFPEAMVSEALVFPSSGVQHVNGQRSILLRERFLPVFKLTELLRLPHPPAENRADLPIVLCEWSGQRMGVEVHRILRRGEMLIRETHPRIAALPGIGGISTMGFDRIVLVLDPDQMFELARKASVFGLRVSPEQLASLGGAVPTEELVAPSPDHAPGREQAS